jgi:hypothetical protein
MDRLDDYWEESGFGVAGLLEVLTTHHDVRRLTVTFQHGFGDEELLMAYKLERKHPEVFRRRSHEGKGDPAQPVSSSTNVRPVVHSPHVYSEFALKSLPPASRITKEHYLILMREIGGSQNIEDTRLVFTARWSLQRKEVEPVPFERCIEGLMELCRALCTNRTMSTLQIQLSGKAPDVLALSQGFDTNVSSPSQLLTIDPAEKRMMQLAIAMKVAIIEFAFLLCHNEALQTIQIQSDNNSHKDLVKLVRPLTKDLDVQQAAVQQQSHVDLAKLHVTISRGAMSAAVCNLAFHGVFQSSTLKELTVETLHHYVDILESSPGCALLQALVRPLIVDEAGQEAKANLSKLTLVLPHVRMNGSWSRAIFAEILPELLQRNSTLKELTVEGPYFYEPREDMREENLCALLQSLKENKSLEILNLSECPGILTQRVIPTLMDILLVNFTLRDINFGVSPIWYSVKEQLRKNEKYMQSCLRKLPVAKAQAARVFLCGGPYAGMCHGIGVIPHMLCLT